MAATKDILIREPSLAECRAFAPVVAQIAQQGTFAALSVDFEASAAILERWLGDENRFVRVAEAGGAMAGAMAGAMIGHVTQQWFSQDWTAHDSLLFVAPEYRGRGIGSDLAAAFARWAHGRGAKLIFMANSLGGVDRCFPGFSQAGSIYVKEIAHV